MAADAQIEIDDEAEFLLAGIGCGRSVIRRLLLLVSTEPRP